MKLKFGQFRAGYYLIFLSIFSMAAYSQKNTWMKDDKFKLSVGTFLTDYESDFRLTSDKLGVGTNVSFEDTLGLDESNTVLRLDGHARLADRHRIEFSYLDLSRDGEATTQFPIIIDTTLFRRGSRLKTDFDFQVYKLAYAYSVWQSEKIDFSLSAGAYTFDMNLDISSDQGQKETETSTSPFPMLGAHFDYRLLSNLFFTTSFEYFAIDENDFEGELTDSIISLEYRPFDHIGLGVGYNRVSIYAEDTNGDDEFDYEYDGVMAFITLVF